MLRLSALALLWVSFGDAAFAQPLPAPSEGRSYLSRSWTWRDYDAHFQNWAVVQDSEGAVFVANSTGVLEYDGEEWRLHSMPDEERLLVRSLAVDRNDNVYVGGVGDFGVLRPDSLGRRQYVSLRPHLLEDHLMFADVWTTHVTDRGVVFQTAERIFRWNGEEMESWETSTRFRTAYLVDEQVYLWEEGAGLKVLGEERISSIRGGRAFATRKVDAALPHVSGLLLVVRDEGLVLLSNGRERRLDTDASAYLREFRPYTAVGVPDPYDPSGSLYAVATFDGGVAIIDSRGRLVRVYREDVGLTSADRNVGLHLDSQGGLWVARTNGLTRIDLFASLTRFDETNGLEGSVYTLAEYGGDLYAGTSNGMYRLVAGALGRPGPGRTYAGFERVEALGDAQVWTTLSTAHGLMIGTSDGVWIQDGPVSYRVGATEAFSLLSLDDRTVLFGSKDGVGRLVHRGGRWNVETRIDGVAGEIRNLDEGVEGEVWALELNGALYRIMHVSAEAPVVQRFDDASGFTVSAGALVGRGDAMWLASREGVFSIRPDADRVWLDPVQGLRDVSGVYAVYESGGHLWINQEGRLYRADSEADGEHRLDLRGVNVTDLLEADGGVLWVGTADGLLRYDPRVGPMGETYTASVRMVTDRDREPLFAGSGDPGVLEVPYARGRQVRLEVAASFFDAPGMTEYQYRLDGFDDDWGAWSGERVAGYTNLWPGTYTLHVRARDLYGRVSPASSFAFRIVPPWYLTWWAYAAYGLGAVAGVWGLTSWRSREHRRRLNAQQARTTRFQRLSSRLEKTNARLRQADKLKDDLLANTSHELRTPLTAVLGFSEMLLDEVEGDSRSLAEGIHRGGHRLLTTVNGLLDMFKLQSGTMPVHARAVDVAQAVRESVGLLQPLAAAQGTDLHILPEGLTLSATLDPDLLDRVVTNVVSNALKFTEAGRVLVLVDGDERWVHVTVQDTGIGIAEQDLSRILEPFEQASTGFERTHEGTGLGLSIVQRVLSLVGGRMTFESEPGVGTTVRIVVPREWNGAGAPTAAAPEGAYPGIDGVHVLALGLEDDAVRVVRRVVGAQGTVSASTTLARALRDARTSVYDVLLVAPEDVDAGWRQVRALRAVPGYAHVPVIRLGGGASEAEGYDGHLALPLRSSDVGVCLETVLTRVETLVDHALLMRA